VSGAASAQQDNEIAEAAAAAFAAAKTAVVTRVPAARVADAFGRNETVLETDAFRVNPSHRDGPGEAEVHIWDGDIMYVLDGSASLVTGGTVVDPKMVAPGEIRGPRIDGGVVHDLAAGDVIHIPRGVPHWFRKVARPFRYYVIKDSNRSAG
jgi:glc operon protein GlcG